MSFLRRKLRKVRNAVTGLSSPRVRSAQQLGTPEFLRQFEIGAGGNESAGQLLQHFQHRVAGDWPAIPTVLTDLRIDLSRMTDDEIIQKADEVLNGDLHPSGLRPNYGENGELDWEFNPSDSREWLLMLHRHGWWPLWGAAYQRTGDEKYARAFVAQLLDWIDKHPLPKRKSEHLTPWRLMEAGLRMRISWIPSFGCFFDSVEFPDAAKLKMLRALRDHGEFLYNFHTNRNHLLRESNGLLALALCFDEFSGSDDWVGAAVQRLEMELLAQVNADGSHLEMSVGYQWLTVVEFEVTRSLLRRYNRDSAIADLDVTLRKMYEFLAAVIRPDGSFPQLNDGFILWDASQLAEAGKQQGWGDIEYVGSLGGSGTMPDFCSRSFPNAGFHVMRSDWTRDARYLVADTGPFGGPHGHEDKLSFELSAYGAHFIVDPGSYTYLRTDPYRTYFVGSQGHNAVLVDSGSQVRRWNSKHMTPAVEDVVHGSWCSDDDLDVASGQYDEGYAAYSMSRPENPDIALGVIHRRDFVFAKPDYWVVTDRLSATSPHDYTFLFHLAPDVVVEELSGSSAIVRSASNGARLVIEALTKQALSSEEIRGSESPIQGWYSEDHHKKCGSPVLSFATSQADSVFVAWVLYPLPPDADASGVSASIEYDADAGYQDLCVRRGSQSDRIRIADDSDSGRKSCRADFSRNYQQ